MLVHCVHSTLHYWSNEFGDQTMLKKSTGNNIITSIHNLHRKPLKLLSKRSLNGIWNNIVKADSEHEMMGVVPDNFIFCDSRKR